MFEQILENPQKINFTKISLAILKLHSDQLADRHTDRQT